MSKSRSKQKAIAWVLLLVFSVQTFWPTTAYALTSGPTTPEMTAFQPASIDNMVDLFSGDFSYNIPLLDVGGYPVNISYHSGSGPEEEASWVGYGWSLNPGAINRQLRGLPDDFNGDVITQEDNKKPNITVGGNVNASIKIFGNRLPKIKIGKKKKNLDGSVKVKIGILHNNYTGYKGMIGIGPGFNTSDDAADLNTKNLSATSTDFSAAAGLNVDNQSGVNPYASFDMNFKIKSKKERDAETKLAEKNEEYTKSIPEGKKFNRVDWEKATKDERAALNEASIGSQSQNAAHLSFNSFQAPGLVQMPMISKNFTASLSLGITLFGGTVSPGIEGTFSKQELKDQVNTAPAYGFMNGHIAKSREEAILDYNMEKESPYFKRLPNLGVTVFTPDLFSVTSNAGSMQFRPYLRGAGIYFQPHKHDVDKSLDIGLEPAFGNIFHLGIPLQIQKTNSLSGKWTTKNDYLSLGDFKPTDTNDPSKQAFYFKRVGEKNRQDNLYFDAIGNTSPVAVKLDDSFSAWAFGNGKASQQMRKNTPGLLTGNSTKNFRDKANHSITYLTAAEADKYALDKQLVSYNENMLPTDAGSKINISRLNYYRKGHHISQYTITQDDGQRMVYGVPVYNIEQEEVSFAIPHNALAMSKGIATYNAGDNSINNRNGKDWYYHKYKTPSYTTGHLLSAILSPDYVDRTGNGVSDDDPGTAVKFNYSLVNNGGEATRYKWRTPYTNEASNQNTANYNEGYRSITDDDKANYTYGEKELWYLHSIESKTTVAQFIVAADREDAAGVVNKDGGVDQSLKQRRLMEIRLYSKSDLYANPGTAVPIKVVHFQYYPDYPLVNLSPNNTHSGTKRGKLTLQKIWFTYGNNTKGQYNSYEFKYTIPSNNIYEDMQSDRWGSYKPKSANPNGLTNLEFPYSIQYKAEADIFASAWQLSEIELPSGGVITVQYESDDYSYVQDRRAAQMCFITGLGTISGTTGFPTSDKVYVRLPVATNNAALKKRYFEGLKSLAYKVYMNLDGKGHWEYVSGYADITGYTIANPGAGGNGDIVEITVGKINGYNPIAKSAWQKLKLDLPRYAYPEYDNLDAEGMGFIKAIKALAATFGRFKDIIENFDHRAKRKGFGNEIIAAKSWVRLCTPIGINESTKGKLGGGHRVKQVKINDKWATMSGVATAETGIYGQQYDYTTTISGPTGATETISSGVASYEPVMGGDENPFHEPINYVDKHLFGMPKYFYLERPMGESYFPGSSVGYSKVTVRNLGADGNVGENGYSVTEFYTGKDFPTKVNDLPMERKQPKLSFLPSLFGAKLTNGVTVSQGYVVENNDMHGKQKAEAVYGKNGNEISSAKYFYKVDNPNAEKLDLNNTVSVVDKTGNITPGATVGMDIDMFTEMNESSMENMGIAIDPSFGITIYPPIIIKISIKFPLPKPNYERRLYRGSSTIKLVNRYGILEKSVKTVNGSTSTAENMLWDAETGDVLLSKVNNEFKDNVYTFSYPAHWMYDGMGSAFRNEGVYLPGFTTLASGKLVTNYNGLIAPGDELIDVNGTNKYWVTNPDEDHNNDPVYQDLYLVDKDGKVAPISAATNMKILRSGRRNLAIASVGSIVTMNNPISGTSLSFGTGSNVLQSNAVNYNQYWPMPIDFTPGSGIPTDCGSSKSGKTEASFSCTCDCLKKFFDYLIWSNNLFIQQSQNITVGQLIAQANAKCYNIGSCPILDNNLNQPFFALTSATTGTIYTAQIGSCTVSITSNSGNPISFYSLVSQACSGTPVVNYAAPTGATQTISTTYTMSCATVFKHYNNAPGYPTGWVPTPNSPKIMMGNPVGGGGDPFVSTEVNFPVADALPINATIVSANFYAYAAPDGYMPPTYPNAHSASYNPSNPNKIIELQLFGCPIWDCTTFMASGNGATAITPIATAPFQDFVFDVKTQMQNKLAQKALNNQKGIGTFGFWGGGYTSTRHYLTFASNFHANTSKHPRLEVTYTVPALTTNAATLQINSCSGGQCQPPVFNPYVTGVLGNWRVKKQMQFDTKRVNIKGNVLDPTGTDLRNSGHFEAFTAYWFWNTGQGRWQENPTNEPQWQWTTTVSKFNKKGHEIENFDALDRYTSALYGYLQSIPIATSANARYREIAYDGFEDYNFNLGLPNPPVTDSCKVQDHFSFRNSLGAAASLDNTKSHSGKYSLKLTGTAMVIKPMLAQEPSLIHAIDASYQYKVSNGYLRFGFLPIPSKKYIISGWVNDGQPKSATINGLTFKVNNITYNLNDNATSPAMFSKIHVVEGWKRFEMVITLPASGTFKLELGGSNINVDDIRIHPYDAQLKSFAYDASSLRLMATMDENNFATFYEYDDEGTLIRVKKETEKGISTIKETRSSIRKKL